MDALYQYLVHDFFRRLLSGDDAVAERVKQFDGPVWLRDGELLFTLPGVFKLALVNFERDRPDAESIDPDDYLLFRKSIYDQPTNTILEHYGGVVEIDTANQDQTLTVYRLTRKDLAPNR